MMMDDGARSLEPETLSTLLRMGLEGPRRPVDDLIDRIAQHDGHAWLDRMIRHDLPAGERRIIQRVLLRQAQLDEVHELKAMAKERLAQVRTSQERVSSLLSYFAAIAGGLAQFRLSITSRGAGDLVPALLDLAEVVPERMASLFADAALHAGA